jgi:hypothetical protein
MAKKQEHLDINMKKQYNKKLTIKETIKESDSVYMEFPGASAK